MLKVNPKNKLEKYDHWMQVLNFWDFDSGVASEV